MGQSTLYKTKQAHFLGSVQMKYSYLSMALFSWGEKKTGIA